MDAGFIASMSNPMYKVYVYSMHEKRRIAWRNKMGQLHKDINIELSRDFQQLMTYSASSSNSQSVYQYVHLYSA